jgi:RecA-family ATPase
VDGWIGYYPTLIAGRGSAGKSLLMQQLASAMAVGRNFLGHIEAPKRVLYWACEEDHDELWRRQVNFARWLNVGLDAFDENFIAQARLGLDNTLYATSFGRPAWTPLIEDLRQQCNDYDADILVVDNIGQVFGANENARHDVTAFINGLIGLVPDRPFGIVLIGHPAKIAGSEFAGNGAWENAVRMRLFLGDRLPDEKQPEAEEETDSRVRVLAKRKTNYSERDYVRFTLDEGVFIPEQGNDCSGVYAALKHKKAREVVLRGLDKLTEMGINTSEHGSRISLPRLILEYRLSEGCAAGELTSALRDLMVEGVIVRGETGRNSARHKREGLVIAREARK